MPLDTQKQPQNENHHFRLFRPILLVFLCILILLGKVVFENLEPKKKVEASDLTISNIIAAINKERELRNLLTLNTDSRLSSAAQSKAVDMVTRKYFSHTDPEGNYIWPKIVAAGYSPYLQLGENLAIEFYNTESLVSAWMNSPTHRANIINESFKDQGMGLEFGNTQNSEYHSAIANTFGSLLVKKVVTPPPPPPPTAGISTPPPAPVPTPKPSPSPKLTPTPPPPAPTPLPPPSALSLRGSEEERDFTTAKENEVEAPTTSGSTLPSVEEVGVKGPSTKPQRVKANRYASIAILVVIVLLLVTDVKLILQKKLKFLDKKMNNIVLLILSLLVIAFMYWM